MLQSASGVSPYVAACISRQYEICKMMDGSLLQLALPCFCLANHLFAVQNIGNSKRMDLDPSGS